VHVIAAGRSEVGRCVSSLTLVLYYRAAAPVTNTFQ